MVGGLVHLQAAGIGLAPVPAAEVIRAVGGVEQPMEIDREHVADHAGHEQVLELGGGRGVAVVEGDAQVAPAAPARVQDALHLPRVNRHRLLADHIHAVLHRAADIIRVGRAGRGDDDGIGPGLVQHALEVGVGIQPGSPPLFTPVSEEPGSPGVAVAQPHQLRRFGIGLDQGLGVHESPPAGAHLRVAFLLRHAASSFLNT